MLVQYLRDSVRASTAPARRNRTPARPADTLKLIDHLVNWHAGTQGQRYHAADRLGIGHRVVARFADLANISNGWPHGC